MNYFWLIIVGITAGWFAGQFMTGKGFGVTGDLIASVIGALIGGAIFEKAGLFAGGGVIGSLLAAITGAIVLLYGVRMVKKT